MPACACKPAAISTLAAPIHSTRLRTAGAVSVEVAGSGGATAVHQLRGVDFRRACSRVRTPRRFLLVTDKLQGVGYPRFVSTIQTGGNHVRCSATVLRVPRGRVVGPVHSGARRRRQRREADRDRDDRLSRWPFRAVRDQSKWRCHPQRRGTRRTDDQGEAGEGDSRAKGNGSRTRQAPQGREHRLEQADGDRGDRREVRLGEDRRQNPAGQLLPVQGADYTRAAAGSKNQKSWFWSSESRAR